MKPDRIAIAGDSAGGGLTLASLVKMRDEGLPLPAAGYLLSPWADMTCTAETMTSKAEEDPALDQAGLQVAAGHYLSGTATDNPLASPVYADLSGLPPLLMQVGSAEILLGDSLAIAARAGAAGTHVQLEVWPEMVHVWQAFAFMLDEGQDAIDAAGRFLRARLAGEH
jgi:acetyl esterase/lipase